MCSLKMLKIAILVNMSKHHDVRQSDEDASMSFSKSPKSTNVIVWLRIAGIIAIVRLKRWEEVLASSDERRKVPICTTLDDMRSGISWLPVL